MSNGGWEGGGGVKTYIGIDPGANGAIAVIEHYDSGTIHVNFCDIAGSVTDAIYFLKEHSDSMRVRNIHAVIEQTNAYPEGSRSSAYKFGEVRGHLRGACIALGIPILAEPRPADWKKAVGLTLNPPKRLPSGASAEQKKVRQQAMSLYRKEMKRAARDRARELYPQAAPMLTREKDDGRAEALLLCEFGRLLDGKEREP